MICPKCGKEINHVKVYSEAVQNGILEGNRIISYDEPMVFGASDIECPECGNRLIGIEEEDSYYVEEECHGNENCCG